MKGVQGVSGMIILIDGYNLLKQRNPGIYVEDSVREQFIRLLGAYHKRRGHVMMLIFDGGTHLWPIQENKAGIVVIYAGNGKSADDYIKYYIAEHHKDDLLLVSSDRELGLWASKYDIASINSLPFYDIIIDTLAQQDKHKQKPGAAVKTTETEDPFLDALMKDASTHVASKEQDRPKVGDMRAREHRESKIDRLLRKKIEKL